MLRNVERIVREEMDAIGAQELHFPALLPREPYEATGRWTEYGDDIFRLKDRKGDDYLLGPTHEEMFTLVVKDLYSSYKDLPVWLYQIQTKYRDEARPRAGAAARPRVRDEGLLLLRRRRRRASSASYAAHRDGLHQDLRPARLRLRDRQGDVRRDGRLASPRSSWPPPRSARTPTSAARTCDYAANVEAVAGPRAPAASPYDDAPAAHAEQTPDTPTIETLVDHLNATFPRDDRPWTAGDTLKNVLVVLKHPDGTREPLAIGLPGDREVDQKRLEGQLEPDRGRGRSTRPTSRSTRRWSRATSAPACWARRTSPASATCVDPRVVDGTRWVTGADVAGSHVLDLVAGRDFTADGTIEAAEVRDGDPCPDCDDGHAARPPAASRWATSSSSAASTPTRWTCRCSTRTASSSRSRWAPTASASPAPSPRSPRTPTTSSAWSGRARSPRPTCTSSPPARTRRSSRPPTRLADELDAAGPRPCSTTTGPRSRPGVKFKDAELIGVPDDRRGRQGPGRRRRRGQGPGAPASARTSRSPTSSATWSRTVREPVGLPVAED